jgi:putative amidoligase enzyme
MLFSDLTFGVEIECYYPNSAPDLHNALQSAGLLMSRVSTFGTRHQVTPGWKIVPDSSLSDHCPTGFTGVEVVSPILKGEANVADVAKVLDVLKSNGAKVNKACGLHVHVGAQAATPGQLKNLAKVFVKYEHHFDALCPESRRNNWFCKSNRALAGGHGDYAAQIAQTFAALDGVRSVASLAKVMNGGYDQRQHYTQHRYFKLNFQSMASHGTVEFRQAAGTVEAAKATAWIKLCVGLVATAFTLKSVSSQADPGFARLLRKVDRPTADYLKARRVALNRGVELAD